MSGYNKAILVGNLGTDPELKAIDGGNSVLSFRMATSKNWVDKAGEKNEKTEWHNVKIWGKRAEALNKYLSKGSKVFIEGEITTRQWEDKDGGKRYTTDIVASEIVLLGDKGATSDGGTRDATRNGAKQGRFANEELAGGDDNIPF